jgi:hypothetical protein
MEHCLGNLMAHCSEK